MSARHAPLQIALIRRFSSYVASKSDSASNLPRRQSSRPHRQPGDVKNQSATATEAARSYGNLGGVTASGAREISAGRAEAWHIGVAAAGEIRPLPSGVRRLTTKSSFAKSNNAAAIDGNRHWHRSVLRQFAWLAFYYIEQIMSRAWCSALDEAIAATPRQSLALLIVACLRKSTVRVDAPGRLGGMGAEKRGACEAGRIGGLREASKIGRLALAAL